MKLSHRPGVLADNESQHAGGVRTGAYYWFTPLARKPCGAQMEPSIALSFVFISENFQVAGWYQSLLSLNNTWLQPGYGPILVQPLQRLQARQTKPLKRLSRFASPAPG